MALTRRKINSLYEEKETSAAKQEKLDRFRAGYLKDTSAALPETKNPPVKISAGGFTEQAVGDIRADLMQAADATRNAKSGNAASAAIQGMSGYIGKNAEPTKEKTAAYEKTFKAASSVPVLPAVPYATKETTKNFASPMVGALPSGDISKLPVSNAAKRDMVSGGAVNAVTTPEYKQANGAEYILRKNISSLKNAALDLVDGLKTIPDTMKAYFKNELQAGKERMATGYSSTDSLLAANKAQTAKMEELADKRDRTTEQELQYGEKYKNARNNMVTSFVADATSSISYMAPMVLASLLPGSAGTLASGATIGMQTMTGAYNDAVASGASKEDASAYAALEAMNSIGGEHLVGGVLGLGTGVVDSAANRIAGEALQKFFTSKPVLKATTGFIAKSLGEGAEEILQGLITTNNQRLTYDPDAKVDWKELGYEGLIGAAMGSAYQGIGKGTSKIAEKVSAGSHSVVNDLSKAAASVQTFGEVQQLEDIMDTVIVSCEEAKSIAVEPDDIAELEYIKESVSVMKWELEANAEDIISRNKGTDVSEEGQNAPISEDVAKTEETAAISDEENNVEEDIETLDELVDEESPVEKSLRIAETDVYTAGNELVNAYGGVVEKAVDALYAEGNRLVKDGSAEARAKLNIVEAVRNDILSNNTKRVERNASHLNKILTEYGIQNVTVDMELADGEERGYYDPATKTIHLSPKLSSSEAVNFVIAHELGHHAAAADSTIVNDIMNIMPKMVEKGIFSAERFSYNRYLAAYAQIASKHAASASGQAELKAHMDAGMTKEQAVQRIVDDYIHQEMASDILGELAKNPDILKRLKREDRTLWQRIVDALKDLAAKLTGKTETRQQEKMLETIRGILEDVSGETVERSGVQQVSADKDVRMSKDITQDDVSALRSVGRKSVNEFTSEDIAKSEKWARIYYSDIGEKSPFFRAWFGDWRENQTEPVVKANIPAYENSNESRKQSRGDITNTDTGWTVRISREGETNTISHSGENRMSEYGLAGIQELMKNAVLLDTEVHEHHSNNAKNDMIAFDHKFYALGVSENGDTGLYKITVEDYFQSKKEPSNKRFHNLKYIEKIADNVGGRTFGQDRSGGSTNDISTTEYSIADLFSFVKKYDAEFKPKPASEIRNEDGTPKVMYHGTKEQFTVFDKKKAKSSGLYGKGFYFTGSESHSGQYGDSMAVYLDIKRPLSPDTDTVTEDQIRTFLEAVAENEDYSIENYGTYDVDEILNGITSRDMFGVLQDINATAIGNFVEAVELFNEVNGTEYDGIVVPTETVAFRANQIKSATDNVGTFDSGNADIRFSMEVFTEEEKLKFKLQEQKNFIKRQYTAETAFGSAVAASPAQRKAFSTEVAHGLPGVTIETVERAIAPVWDIFEKAKGGSDDTVQSRVEQAYTKAQEAAEDLISRVAAKRINPQYEQYYELRKRLRTTPIRNDVSVQEFGGAEDYAEWRKKNKGLLRISDSADAVGIDTLYSELCDAYPEFFSKDVENPTDMLKRLGEVAVELKKTASAEKVDFDPLEGYKHEAASELADRIMLGFQQHSSMTMNAKNRLESEKAEKRLKDFEQESQKAFRMQQEEHKRQTASIVRDFNSSINKLMREVDRQNQKIDRLTTTLTGRNSNLMMAAEKKRFLGNLNKLYTMLTEPNKKKHIPETMKRDVAELLKQFEGIVLTDKKFVDAKLLGSIVHSVPDMQIENGDLRVEDPFVSSLKNDLDILNGIRETIASDQMDPNTQQETLVRMNTDYMRAANTILKKLNGYIMTQNQIFIDGKIQEADVFSDDLISELTGRKRYAQGDTKSTFGGTLKNVGRNFADKLHYEAMNAGLFFEMIGESGVQLDHTFRKGQDKQAAHEKEFASYMKRITGGKYNTFAAAGLGGERIQISIDGHDIDVSKAQLMSLYLLWKRPAARRHLEAQGAVFTDANGKEFEARTFVITHGTMDELIKHLSEEDIRVADAMQRFLAHQCSEWGNEASMQMYGYRMYEDPDYFPIRVSETVKMRNAPAWGAQIGDISLENSGFTKHVDRNSTSAIVVGNVFDITENHVKRMASYNAYAPICNDLQRVLSRSDVRGAIIRGLGDRGLRYIDNFLKNVNDNKVMQKETSGNYAWMQFLGNMSKRAAVSYNISTAVKQPLSILRVFNEMDPAFVLQAMTSKGLDARVYQSPEYKRLYDTMVENSGVAKMKMLGYSDAGFAKSLRQQWDDNAVNTDGALRSVMTAGKVTRAVTKGYDRITDFGMKGAAWADERTWVTIWKACELETAKKYHSLSAEERLSKTTERFGEIIGRTQVVDSLLDTTPFKEGTIGTGLGAFMNEPVKQYANLVVAVDGLKNGNKGARKKLAVVLSTTLANSLILEPMVSAIFSGLRDEEDDSDQAFRKFVKNYLGIDLTDKSEGVKATDIASSQFVDGLVGIVPLVGEIYGIIADALAGYDNTRFETDGLQQVVQSVTSLFTGGESKTTGKKVSELLSAVGMITGVPYKTLSRDIRAVFRNFYNATDNHLAAWNMNKLYYNLDSSSARSGKNFYDIMAHAYKEGDTEAYQQMRKELAEIPTSSSFGVSQKTITDNIEKRGGEVTVGSQLWYVDLQSSFHLEYFNKGMVPERMITEVYRKTKDNSVLPSPPSNTFTVNGESVKIEDPIQQEQFAAEVGDFSYRILMNMASSDSYRNLNDAQKQYAIEKAYDYARRRSRKKLYSAYDMGENLFKELYEKNAAPSSVASGILGKAKEKK